MAQLLCKTRGNTTSQGKPRVYFTCHPEDWEQYFEPITEEILQSSNCAVYYYEADAEPDIEELKQMQLFVIPVTARLLFTQNRILEVELPIARQQHIPLLPLMQEPDLNAAYSRVFGNLQYLNKLEMDPTALPYEEKLQKFLDRVLVGEQLAEKIRAAFDAYVFLSYRKKDRKLAQELMRLIHKIPFCRDMAIWYDEFLSPNEDFNDAITAALNKSELFVLTVTPNLVNEPNYIQTTEYPMAVQANKTILPVQMDPTDPDALCATYAGIPGQIDPADEENFAKSMKTALRAVALRENDSPEHDFFIGLAYLMGVDVEVDRDRAVNLITSAADAGLTEAMNKLVQMYSAGDGVAQNEHMAVHWQEKLLEQARERYEQTQEIQDGYAYLDALMKTAQEWKSFGEHGKAEELYRKMLDCAIELSGVTEQLQCKWYLAVAYRRVAGIYQKKEDYQTAKEYLEKAKDVWLELAEGGESYIQHNLALVYQDLGDIACYSCDYTPEKEDAAYRESARWYQKALEIYEKRAESGNAEELHTLASFYETLGSHYKFAYRRDDVRSSWAWLEMALKIRQDLVKSGTTYDLRKLASTYETMALRNSRGEEKKAYRQKALEIREQLAGKKEHASLWSLAENYWYTHQEAKAVEIAETLAATGVTRYMKGLAEWCCWLADEEWDKYFDKLFPDGMLRGENLTLTEDANLYWENKHLDILRRMAEKGLYEGEDKWIQRHIYIGIKYANFRMYGKAMEWKEKAVALREEAAKDGREETAWKLIHEYAELAATYAAAKETQRQRQLYDKTVAVLEKLGDPPTEDLATEAALAYMDVAEAENDPIKLQRAKELAKMGNAEWLFTGDLFS